MRNVNDENNRTQNNFEDFRIVSYEWLSLSTYAKNYDTKNWKVIGVLTLKLFKIMTHWWCENAIPGILDNFLKAKSGHNNHFWKKILWHPQPNTVLWAVNLE